MTTTKPNLVIADESLGDHMIRWHGFNDDTVSIWDLAELRAQHERYHADPTAEHLGHAHPDEEVAMITSRCAEGDHHLCARGKHLPSLDYTIPCDCECHQPKPFDRAAFVNAVDQIVSHLERAQGVVEHEHLRLHHDFNSHFTKALLAANQAYRMLNP